MVPKPGRWKSASVVSSNWKVLVSWAMPPVTMRIMTSRTNPQGERSSNRNVHYVPPTEAGVGEPLEVVAETVHRQVRQGRRGDDCRLGEGVPKRRAPRRGREGRQES